MAAQITRKIWTSAPGRPPGGGRKPNLAEAEGEKKAQLQQEYKNDLRKAKNTKLVTQIQMIFQDPIASL
ncbi:MAG: hypothetical protein IIW82_04510, partial [Clostridia bacterium]|nr:hypothetical protein [Clostridia bacterium]